MILQAGGWWAAQVSANPPIANKKHRHPERPSKPLWRSEGAEGLWNRANKRAPQVFLSYYLSHVLFSRILDPHCLCRADCSRDPLADDTPEQSSELAPERGDDPVS